MEQEDSHRGQEGTLGSVRDADLGVYRSWVEGAGGLGPSLRTVPKVSYHYTGGIISPTSDGLH